MFLVVYVCCVCVYAPIAFGRECTVALQYLYYQCVMLTQSHTYTPIGECAYVYMCVCNCADVNAAPSLLALFLSAVSQLGGESAHGEPLFEQRWKTNKTAAARTGSLGNTRERCSHSLHNPSTYTHNIPP